MKQLFHDNKPKNKVYSCKHTPTLRAFHNDDSFVRGIMGPVGGGKSTACVMEILMRSMAQAKSPDDGIRYTRWAIVRNCYDDQTEILTEDRGWQFFDDLTDTDKVATLVDEKIKYQLPEGVLRAPYKGEMIGFENEGADFLVTPDHKMYVSKCRTRKQVWGAFEEKTAEQIYGSCKYRVKRDAKWVGKLVGKNVKDFSPDVFEWLGFWFAEGHIGETDGKRRLAVTQMKKEGRRYTRRLFKKAGIAFFESGKNFTVRKLNESGGKWYRLLKDCGLQGVRSVPVWIKNAPSEHLKSFIKGYTKGDGHTDERGTTRLYTSSKILADDLQEMALKAGSVANIASRDRRGKKFEINGVKTQVNYIEYTVTLLGKRKYNPKLYLNKNIKTKRKGWYKVDYDGMVYCVEMPLVPVYVRRNGKAFWCYRSYPQLKTTTLKTWNMWCPPSYGALTIGSPIRHHVRTNDIDMEVYFMPLDGEEDVKKVLSLELTGCWINEAREIDKTILDALTTRVGRYPELDKGGCTWKGVFMDTNPPDDQSWWYRLCEEQKPANWKFFKQPSALSEEAENIPNLPSADYYQNITAGKDPDWVKVYVKGEYGYVTEGKPVFGNYRDRMHASTERVEPVPGVPLLIGIDFGLTPAAVVGQKLVDGRWLILDEFCTEDTGIVRFAQTFSKYLSSTFPDFEIQGGWGDPSGKTKGGLSEETSFDIMNEYFPLDRWGANVHSAAGKATRWRPAPTNEVAMRLEAVRVALDRLVDGRPGILIAPRCKLIRKGFSGGYHYKFIRPGSEQTHEHPVKNSFSHPMDALQYLLLGGGEHNVVLRKVDRMKVNPNDSGNQVVKGLDYKIFG